VSCTNFLLNYFNNNKQQKTKTGAEEEEEEDNEDDYTMWTVFLVLLSVTHGRFNK